MGMRLALGILGLCLTSIGCGPLAHAIQIVVVEPIQYCQTADDFLENRRNYKLAEEAWQELAQANPGHPSSPDYVNGFMDGFADYLYAGGTGEPPPLPPRQYWRITYETPEGHQAIQDWFAGFRHGAAIARESGYREGVTIPSSLPSPNAADPYLSTTLQESTAPPSEEVLPPPKELPPPKKIDAPQRPENGK
jgi:hypothetical protein